LKVAATVRAGPVAVVEQDRDRRVHRDVSHRHVRTPVGIEVPDRDPLRAYAGCKAERG